MQSSILYCAIF